MKIKTYLNCVKQEIESKEFNIFIGISLGNKYFSKENIKKYILWALKYTKNDVLVLIVDEINEVNYEVFNKCISKDALKLALNKGSEMEKNIKKIISELPKEKQSFVKIARWEDARKTLYYQNKIELIFNFFKENKEFYNDIIQIVKENLGDKANNLNFSELEMLASYVLKEIPIALNGIEFEGIFYNLFPYPKLSSLELLIMNLREKKKYQKLTNKLDIKNQTAEVIAIV